MRKQKHYLIIIILCLLIVFFSVNNALAVSFSSTLKDFGTLIYGGAPQSPYQIATTVIKTLLTFLGIIFLVIMLYAGFLWMSSGGAEKKIAKAKSLLLYNVIGLFIVLISYSITTFVYKAILSSSTGTSLDACLTVSGTFKSGGSSSGSQPDYWSTQCCNTRYDRYGRPDCDCCSGHKSFCQAHKIPCEHTWCNIPNCDNVTNL